MKMKWALLVAGLATAIAGFAERPAFAQEEIVIGASLGRTGRYSTIAVTTETSIDIAVREINEAGGINGRQVRVVKFDTGGDPKQAVVAVRQFARDDNALAVIGPFSSSETRIAFPAGEREEIVQIPNASSAPKLADKYSYGFRVTESEFIQFRRVVRTLKSRNMMGRSVAILYATDDVVSKAVGTAIMKPIFEQEGVDIVGPIGFATEAFDLSPQVSRLKGEELDFIGIAGLTPVAARTLHELRRQGVQVPIVGGQIWADPANLELFGEDGEGAVFVTWFWYQRDERARQFTEKWVAENARRGIDKPFPHHVDASAYDIVYLLKAAMEEADVTGDPNRVEEERTAIRDALQTITYEGVIGRICFEENGDAQLPGYVITIDNGQWKLLEAHESLPCES